MRRWLRHLTLSVIAVDLATVAVVAVVGARYGYADTAHAVWDWRSQHLLPSLAMSGTILLTTRVVRRRR